MAIEPIRTDVTATVLSNLGNPTFSTTTNNYTIYGMQLPSVSLTSHVETSFDYVSELVGAAAMLQSANYNKIKLFMADYATLRVLGTLQGTVITKHFNYSSGGLNIQKPAVGQMASMIERYTQEVARWRKLLLTRSIVTTGASTSPGSGDLDLAIINEKAPQGSGIEIVTYDSTNL